MSGQSAEVIAGSHRFSVGTGTAHDEQVTSLHGGDLVVFNEDVAGLTDGSDDVVQLFFVIRMGDVLHAMESAV